MKNQLLNLKMIALMCLMMVLGGANVWADKVSYKLFGPKWNATCDEVSANWTSIKDGFTNNKSYVQVTDAYKSSGACANSPISFENIKSVTIHYHTNPSKGQGTISIYGVEQNSSAAKSGTQIGSTFTVTKPSSGGDLSKSKTFTPSNSVSGYVQIYVTCSTNSVYIESVDIEYDPASSVKYDVTWNVNGEVYTKGEPSNKVSEGQKVSTLPTAPEAINGKSFMGWTDAPISASQDATPVVLFTDVAYAPNVTGDVTYYAVFANKAGSEVTYTKLTSDQFKTDATYVIGAEQSDEDNTMWYFCDYEDNTSANIDWGITTSTPSVVSPVTFTLSGSASALIAKDNNGNYLTSLTSRKFKMSSKEVKIGLSTEGSIQNPSNNSWKLRYNYNKGNGGFRWYNTDPSGTTLAYFYEVSGGYTYSGYCTTVGATAKPTYTPAKVNFVAHAGTYYATFSNAKVVFMPKNVTVQTVTVESNKITFTTNVEGVFGDPAIVYIEGSEITGYYIPANTGVLLNSKNSGEVTYYTVENKDVKPFDAEVNMLMPSVAGGVFTAEPGKVYYKLAYNDYKAQTGLGFYWGADNGGAFKVKAGTAYLAVPAGEATAKGFTLNGEATGIEGVNANLENAKAIYNLNGQRVASMAKPGLYIVNGKKVVRK